MDYDKLYENDKPVKKREKLKPLKAGTAREQFQEMEPEVIEALRRVLNSSDSSGSAIVSAATSILDRLLGKQAASADANADKLLEITIVRQCPACQLLEPHVKP